MLILGILAKRVKIGKNLSIRAFGCRNIKLYSQIASSDRTGRSAFSGSRELLGRPTPAIVQVPRFKLSGSKAPLFPQNKP
jgi:hypothetical protein